MSSRCRRPRCRYSDTVDIDAGPFTAAVAKAAVAIYRYRQRRWHKLVDRHLLPTGPAYAHPSGVHAVPGDAV